MRSLSETDAEGLPVPNKVAGFVVTGNEDGAHHVIAEVARARSTSRRRSTSHRRDGVVEQDRRGRS